MFLVKREESRSFDVFLGHFFVCFLCLGEGKNVLKNQAKSKIQQKMVSPGLKGAWAFYSPNTNFEVTAVQGLPASNVL